MCENKYKEKKTKFIDKDNNKQTKSFKEIAIQVHELKPLNFDVHSHAKMAN